LASIAFAARRRTLNVPIRLIRDHPLERLDCVRAAAAGDTLGRSDAGARHGDAQAAVTGGCGHGGLDLAGLADVRAYEARVAAELDRELIAAPASTSAITTRAPPA
jgi:hypothetical protein